jgi:hypothetical protein
VGSKLVWEELNERACVVDALGPRGEEAYAMTVRQDFPNAPMYIDPVAYSKVVICTSRLYGFVEVRRP